MLKIIVNGNVIEENIFVEYIDDLFLRIGELLLEASEEKPSLVKIEAYDDVSDDVVCSFSFKKRGYTEVAGETVPSLHCDYQLLNEFYVESRNFKRRNLEKVELRYTSNVRNSYKRYKIDSLLASDNYLYIHYGSLDLEDTELRTVEYPWFMYWILYYEKLSKGYVDMSLVFKEEKTETVENTKMFEIKDDSDTLYDMLYKFAYNFAEKYVRNTKPTKEQIRLLKENYGLLKETTDVTTFNEIMKKIVMLSPRTRDPLRDSILIYYAKSTDDFRNILDFELKLITALEVLANSEGKTLEFENTFKTLGIEVYEATDKQYDIVLNHLSDYYKSKVQKVYRVIPKVAQENFSNYLKENDIKTVKQFWHGSVNSNWLSIITNGLKINSKVANGRMFGDGIYFAPDCDKSFGYTSYYNTRWARGTSDVGIMGLYATAYGTPFSPTSYGYDTKGDMTRNNCNCVHAKGATLGLRKDEIIFYNEMAICLNYIVIFG